MEYFSEEHAQLLLGIEWVVKVDAQQSKTYLFKATSDESGKCICLLTDTIHVWAEVLTRAQFSRRWAICNKVISMDLVDVNEAVRVLFTAHTISGVDEIDFERADSPYCDAKFNIQFDAGAPSEAWAWAWETFAIGPVLAPQILSQQLVIPLMTAMHLSFQSAEPVRDLGDKDLEQAVDKMTRTARRSMDTHVRHAMSGPKNASTLRRITAMLNQTATLPPIVSETTDVDLVRRPLVNVPAPNLSQSRLSSGSEAEDPSNSPGNPAFPLPQSSTHDIATPTAPDMTSRRQLVRRAPKVSSPVSERESVPLTVQSRSTSGKARIDPDEDAEMKNASSDTETEDEDDPTGADTSAKTGVHAEPSPPHVAAIPPPARPNDSDSSLERPPPVKKAKPVSSSDESSEAERRKHVARVTGSSRRGGARQPLKRGAKRF